VNQANTSDVVKSIVEPLAKLPVSMLINNVGINTDGSYPAELTDHSVAEVESMIRVNCTFTALLTRAFIPILKQNVKPRAAIVNLGSMSSLFPSAMMSIYAGTKAFDDAFSYALTAELKQFKIDVTSVLPGYVTSSMSNIKRSSILVPSEKSFGHLVASVIGAPRSIPYWAHSLYVAVITRLPDSFVFKKVVRNMKVCHHIFVVFENNCSDFLYLVQDIRGRLLARAAKKATEAKQQ
jgi:17beta-estradiol 17-dehydrogenase / very-long-chain 3-oxoacyl-CoA reductase